MAGGFGTTTDEMERAGRQVLSVNETVQGDLSALRGQLAPLAGLWRGRAATEFAQLMTRWDASASQLNVALRGIGEGIEILRKPFEADVLLEAVARALGS